MTVFESSFGVAILPIELYVEQAKSIAHDSVIASTGRARRSGVTWNVCHLRDWRAAMAELGIDVPDDRPRPPEDLEEQAKRWPLGLLVVATVEVDPEVDP